MIELSYIITTKNRLSLLKVLFSRLFSELGPNDEIIVVDANSSDGSKEFLADLYARNKIHNFISEPDKSQAEGWNKAMLLAKGVLIKKIIDDDVFDFKAIKRCAAYMLANQHTDILISNCLQANLSNPKEIKEASRLNEYLSWKEKKTESFTFSDVSLMIRRNSLSKLGLYDTQFRMMDWEYALRCSYLQARIVYFTGFLAMGIDTPNNITSGTSAETLKLEERIGQVKYKYKGDRNDISLFSEIKIFIGTFLDQFRTKTKSEVKVADRKINIPALYDHFYTYLNTVNSEKTYDIID